jgi:hypothetical protein
MGKIKKGILGGFSGRVGNVIGGSWKGIDYMRSEATSIANPRTTKQVEVRENFSVIGKLMAGAVQVLRASDWRKTRGNSAFARGVQVNYKDAVIEGSVDFEKLNFGVFSCPSLVSQTCAFSVADNSLKLSMTWSDDTTDIEQTRTDAVYVVIAKKGASDDMDDEIIDILNAKREDEALEATIALINSFTSGDKLYAYVGVVSSTPYAKISARNSATMSATYTVSA